jgi:hypothetical protein
MGLGAELIIINLFAPCRWNLEAVISQLIPDLCPRVAFSDPCLLAAEQSTLLLDSERFDRPPRYRYRTGGNKLRQKQSTSPR